MTRDDVIRLGEEAGIEFQAHCGVLGRVRITTCGSQPVERMERFAHLVIADFLARTGQCVTSDRCLHQIPMQPACAWHRTPEQIALINARETEMAQRVVSINSRRPK